MKIVYILPGIFVIVIIVLILRANLFLPSYSCELSKEFKKSNYCGVIMKKIVDQKNHRTRTLFIRQDTFTFKMILPDDTSGYFEFIKVGDTIIKQKNTDIIKVVNSMGYKNFRIYNECN